LRLGDAGYTETQDESCHHPHNNLSHLHGVPLRYGLLCVSNEPAGTIVLSM
jgi:hypothetical protein